MKRFKQIITFLVVFLSLMQPNTALTQEQMIDTSGFSISTQLPEVAPNVPEGKLYIEINDNKPYFTNKDISDSSPWIEFTNLDTLGRVGPANATLSEDLMPAKVRGNHSNIKPTGWQQQKLKGEYLYNRSHLLGYQLVGDGIANLNLMTGTNEFNQKGMLPFENYVATIVEDGMSVRYRVTPYFEGNNLLASGVFMEGFSIEDNGKALSFNIYVPNRQADVSIDYGTGASSITEQLAQTTDRNYKGTYPGSTLYYAYDRDGTLGVDNDLGITTEPDATESTTNESTAEETEVPAVSASYVANANTGKFHHASCRSVRDMAEHNKVFMDDRDEIINQGYVPCKICKP